MIEFTAFVALKANSERVPGKNLRFLGDRHLFEHILRTLSNVEAVKKIIVDTDSEEMYEIIEKKYPTIDLYWRPLELCGELVDMDLIIKNYLDRTNHGYILHTHATNPFLSVPTISKAINCFWEERSSYDSLFSVNRLQKRIYYSNGELVNKSHLVRTQDIEPLFERNANLYLFSKDSFEKTGCRIGIKPMMFEMNKLESIDIDEPEDFFLAELLFDQMLGKIHE